MARWMTVTAPVSPAGRGRSTCRLRYHPATVSVKMRTTWQRLTHVLSPKTIKNVRATLRRVLASAVEWGVIEKIPAPPKVKVADKGWDFFTGQEGAKLLAVTRNDEEKAMLMFPLRTGGRAGEQLALEWGDIDWVRSEIIFRRSSTGGQVGPTKSGRERRVPIGLGLAGALRKVKHLRGKLVFCQQDGKSFKIWQLHERLWSACRRAGLREIRWHDLRHSFASQLASAGVPLNQIQNWLGQSTINMTMRYAHLAPGTWQRSRPHLGARNADVRGSRMAAKADGRDEAD